MEPLGVGLLPKDEVKKQRCFSIVGKNRARNVRLTHDWGITGIRKIKKHLHLVRTLRCLLLLGD
jgi:hypothetical protein